MPMPAYATGPSLNAAVKTRPGPIAVPLVSWLDDVELLARYGSTEMPCFASFFWSSAARLSVAPATASGVGVCVDDVPTLATDVRASPATRRRSARLKRTRVAAAAAAA